MGLDVSRLKGCERFGADVSGYDNIHTQADDVLGGLDAGTLDGVKVLHVVVGRELAGVGVDHDEELRPSETGVDLASEVRLNVDFDLTMTLCAHLVYQCLGQRLKGFETSTPQKLYRKFVNTPGHIKIGNGELQVVFEKRSHNPILKEAHLDRPTPPIPWCGSRRLSMIFP